MKRDSGNALFLILIAVALFAALSYAITQSGRGGGSVDKETNAITAAQIVQFGGAMEQAMTRMKLMGGTSDTEYSFANPVYKTNGGAVQYPDNHNPFSTDPDDFIFRSAGGGLSPQTFDKAGDTTGITAGAMIPGHAQLVYGQVTGVGSSAPDLLLYIEWVKTEICEEINKKLGLNLPSGAPYDENRDSGASFPRFDGDYTAATPMVFGNDAAALVGQRSFCYHETSALGVGSNPQLFYVHVVLAR